MSGTISVIVPVYNCERFLAEAVASVRAQGVPVHELIVVDDGSTDGSAAIARSVADRVISQANLGIGAARNTGIAAAGGDLLAFLDSDDLWSPDKLALQMAALDADPSLDMVLGEVVQFRGDVTAAGDGEREPGYLAGAMIIRRAAFDRVGTFDPTLRVGEFIDWHARAVDAGLRSRMIPAVVLYRRLHDANLGLRAANSRVDYARVARAALARRRAAAAE